MESKQQFLEEFRVLSLSAQQAASIEIQIPRVLAMFEFACSRGRALVLSSEKLQRTLLKKAVEFAKGVPGQGFEHYVDLLAAPLVTSTLEKKQAQTPVGGDTTSEGGDIKSTEPLEE
jgi:hypothetical protein